MNTTADDRQSSAGAKCYRPRRFYLVIGVVGLVVFCTMGVCATAAAYWNWDGSFADPKLAAGIFAFFWSGFMLLAVWVLLAYFREALYLTEESIIQHRIFRTGILRVADVTHLTWRRFPVDGSLVVRTPTAKIKIYFDNFTTIEREEIIAFFRITFAQVIQDDWVRFLETHPPGSSVG